jgi:hypothetical protein
VSPARIVLVGAAVLYALFLFWYGGSGEPLTPSEADAILAEIEANGRARSGEAFDGELLESFRVLTRHDDGREFTMLNLMRYREKAVYPPGSEFEHDLDAQAAAARYNAAVVPALLRHGSLPILIGDYAGAFIPPDPADTWDQVGIVRYRSRRDMLEMARDLSLRGGGEHKWASIEKTIVFPVAPIFSFVMVRGVVFAVLFGVGGGLAFVLRRRDTGSG